MKLLVFISIFVMSFSSFAADVPGQIFYKKNNGELVRRDVVIEVPSKGQGEVVLKGNNFEWRTTDFWSTRTAQGALQFTAAFQVSFMGNLSTIAFSGTYLRGSNELLYNGNVYKRSGHDPVNQDISSFEYNGGFSFNYIR